MDDTPDDQIDPSNYRDLFAYFQRLTRSAPSVCNRGQEYATAGLHSLALTCFQEAVALNPNYGPGWSDLGVCLFEMKKFEEAEPALRKATEMAPENFVSWGCLGALCVELDKLEDAAHCFERCWELKPDDSRTKWLARRLLDRLQSDSESLVPETADAAVPSEHEEPYVISPNQQTIDLHYIDNRPVWWVAVPDPQQFRDVESKLDFSLFKLRTGALIAYWLRLYDIPDQPYFVHRVLDLSDAHAFQYAKRMAASNRLLVLLETKTSIFSTVEVELAFDEVNLSAILEEGLAHNRELDTTDGRTALNEYTAIFNQSMGKELSVGKAWQAVREALCLK